MGFIFDKLLQYFITCSDCLQKVVAMRIIFYK